MTHNLAYDLSAGNPQQHELVAAMDWGGFIEVLVCWNRNIRFRSFSELAPRTADEEKALGWDPKLLDPEPNFTFETSVDEAIKAARDLYEGQSDPWPVTIWAWKAGGYGYGCSIPEDTDPILLIDGTLGAFGGPRRDVR